MEVAAEAEVMEEEEDMTVAIIRQKMRLLSVWSEFAWYNIEFK